MRPIVRAGAAALAVLVLAGCEDMGVSKASNLPLEVARSQPPKAIFEETARLEPEPPAALAGEPVELAGQWWIVSGTEYQLPPQAVRPVGTAAGSSFHALAWDEAPYDRLLVERVPGVWQEFLEVY